MIILGATNQGIR